MLMRIVSRAAFGEAFAWRFSAWKAVIHMKVSRLYSLSMQQYVQLLVCAHYITLYEMFNANVGGEPREDDMSSSSLNQISPLEHDGRH